eukprot:m.264649 g.264649  ORF g.264649 m.264649 type:complete len:621 (+) comp15619_c0_seq3:313-2175(+)
MSSSRMRSKQLRSEAVSLEHDNVLMEARLSELKQTLKQQKQAREQKGGYSWKSGRRGNLRSHAQSVLDENPERRRHGRRVKVLTSTEPDLSPQVTPSTSASSHSSRTSTHTSGRTPRKPKSLPSAPSAPPQLADGQFRRGRRQPKPPGASGSKSHASSLNTSHSQPQPPNQTLGGSLLDGAFDEAESHSSFLDALAEWRTGGTSSQGTSDTALSTSAAVEAPASTSTAQVDDYPPLPQEGGGKLLEGPMFDEDASHQDFQNALEAWRTGESAATGPPTHVASSGTGSDTMKAPAVDTSVTFESNLSYVEKLMLKKHRKASNPSSRSNSTSTSPLPSATRVAPRFQLDVQGIPEGKAAPGFETDGYDHEHDNDVFGEQQSSDVDIEQAFLSERFAKFSQSDGDLDAEYAGSAPFVRAPSATVLDVFDEAEGTEDGEYHVHGDEDEEDDDEGGPVVEEPSDSEDDDNGALVMQPQSVEIRQTRRKAPEIEEWLQEAKAWNIEKQAATTIQAAFRGHAARQDVKAMQQERAEAKAATKVQALARGFMARQRFAELKAQHEANKAALIIQCAYRKHQAVKTTSQLREEQLKQDALASAETQLRTSVAKDRPIPLKMAGLSSAVP